ncbi:hypothetical protein MTP04_14600 [Lysinibacillus sp. PLM2]|nr:hypothetical protein MTP04_14600 [Lysinibacillus sp. PLM2]
MRFCTNCGKEAGHNEKFCLECGTMLPSNMENNLEQKPSSNDQQSPQDEIVQKICNSCGKIADNNEKFCLNCGTSFQLDSPPLSEETIYEIAPFSMADELKSEEPIHSSVNAFLEDQPTVEFVPTQPQTLNGLDHTHAMNQICTNCGRVQTKLGSYCSECGAPLAVGLDHVQAFEPNDNKPFQNVVNRRSQSNAPQVKEKKTLSLGMKITIVSGIVLFLLIVGAHLYIQKSLDPNSQLEAMNTYFTDEDAEKFSEAFIFPEGTIVDPEAFYYFMVDNDWSNMIYPDLQYALTDFKENGSTLSLEDSNGNLLISIEEEPYLLFYKKINFHVEPVEVTVEANTNGDPVELTFANLETKEITDSSFKLGLFAPGEYKYTLNIKDDYFEKELEEYVSINGKGNSKYSFEIDLSENAVQFTSDIDDAIIYINGENTNKTANEINLFAAPLDGSVEVYAEAVNNEGETIQSETITLTDKNHHLVFSEVQEQMAIEEFHNIYLQDAIDMYQNFRADYNNAINDTDFSYVSEYFVHDSELYKNYEKYVEDHEKIEGFDYHFISNQVTKTEPLSSNSLVLETYEIFVFTSDADGTWHYEKAKRYTIELIDYQLKITNIEEFGESIKNKIDS